MSNTTPDPTKAGSIPALTPEAKRKAKVENERIKFLATLLHSLAIAVIGLGFLRFFFDPGAMWPGYVLIGSAFVISMAFEGLWYYILGRMKPEN